VTTGKSVLRRAQAQEDVADAITYYLEQDALDVAKGFITALEKAIEHINASN
jgi:plasmid stabilization system protein ParE